MLEHRRGKILYLSDSGSERGREWFDRYRNLDGTWTVRTLSEIDDTHLVREVTYTFSARYEPRDAWIRLTIGSATNTGLFRFGAGGVTAEVDMAGQGRLHQELRYEASPGYFGCHPLVGDVLDLAAFDPAGPKRQSVWGVVPSVLVNGSTGPLAALSYIDIEDLGDDEIDLPVGRRRGRHFRMYYADGMTQHGERSLLEDLWEAEDHSFLQARNEELATTYVLAEEY